MPFPLDFLPIIEISPISEILEIWVPAQGHRSKLSPILTTLNSSINLGIKSILVLSGGIIEFISLRIIVNSVTSCFEAIISFVLVDNSDNMTSSKEIGLKSILEWVVLI